jgi:hypothetical protein
MERRDLLRALASATALSFIPHEAHAAWSRVVSGIRSTAGFGDAHMALVRAVADTIIPRTDTPSATDVGVHGFVEVIVYEQASDENRKAFLAGLDAIDARALAESNVVFADMSSEAKGAMIQSFESGPRDADPARTYWRLKGLVVHGYFTSERVMKDVLKTQVMPGKFEGAAPVAIARRPLQAGSPTQKPEEHPHG